MSKVPAVKLNDGRDMPIFGLGTWNSPKGQVEQAVKDAIDCGYRMIDCAHCYGNEHEVGNALKEKITDGTVKRDDLFITTKLWNTFHHPNSVRPAFEVSLKNLQLDYVDLYLIHWPMSYKEDGDKLFPLDANGEFIDGGADFVDTWKAMEELVDSGLVRSIGVSNFNARMIDRVLKNSRITPVTNQVECHPYLNQQKLKAYCEARKILITAYSPLGSPARPWAEKGEPLLVEEPKIVEIAKNHSKNPAQILLRYQVQRGNIVIPKSVTKERIAANFEIFDFMLSDNEVKEIDGLDCGRRLCLESAAINHRDHPFANDEY
ncbi:unnamed protein product [Chironomus riparius]|uniref:NADP-dependent oxidoreductase domain-containing protein n=1 Tax=Chironomus riparius TaxID=315576 RepID=A0A9N9S4W0_9DIPT|nr:unnamed protein product [Chironomus riparius]